MLDGEVMKIIFTLAIVLAFAGCAGTPTERAPQNNTQSVSKQAANNSDKILALQRQGYTMVNRNGEEYFCRSEAKTGSRVQRETVCMTQRELDDLHEMTERNMGNITRQTAPPQGK